MGLVGSANTHRQRWSIFISFLLVVFVSWFGQLMSSIKTEAHSRPPVWKPPAVKIYKADRTTCRVSCCSCLSATRVARSKGATEREMVGERERFQNRSLTQGCALIITQSERVSLIGPLHQFVLRGCFDTAGVKTRWVKGWIPGCAFKLSGCA